MNKLNVIDARPTLEISEASNHTLIHNETTNRLEIVRGISELILDETKIKILSIAEQGPQGAPGLDGADGAPGLSAYEIAVANGFVGTEQDWLDSIQGMLALADDPNPTLGGDLTLGPYNIIGQLENTTLVLDGGLL